MAISTFLAELLELGEGKEVVSPDQPAVGARLLSVSPGDDNLSQVRVECNDTH